MYTSILITQFATVPTTNSTVHWAERAIQQTRLKNRIHAILNLIISHYKGQFFKDFILFYQMISFFIRLNIYDIFVRCTVNRYFFLCQRIKIQIWSAVLLNRVVLFIRILRLSDNPIIFHFKTRLENFNNQLKKDSGVNIYVY